VDTRADAETRVDRIMVLRRGERVDIKDVHEVSAGDIVKLMTGADVIDKV